MRGTTLICWALAAGALFVGLGVLRFVNPAEVSWLPRCPLYEYGGLHCPGCGATRAAHALLHGDLHGALAKNPLLVCMLPLGLAYGIWARSQRGPQWTTRVSHRAVLVLLTVLVAYGVLRNIPQWPFTLLAPH